MAENVTNELLFETLKQIQAKLAEHSEAHLRAANELKAIKHPIHGLVQSDLNRDAGHASLLARIARIERRLELHD